METSWFFSLPFGIAIYNKALQLKKKISKNGLPDVVFWDIFVDREENIWFATENGVYRFSNFDFVNYIPDNVTGSPNIRTGIIYNDAFIFSNNINFFVIKDEALKTIGSSYTSASSDVKMLATPTKTFWLNSYIDRLLNPKVITKSVSIVNNKIIENKMIDYSNYSNSVIDMERVARCNNKEMAFLTLDKKLLAAHDDKIEKFNCLLI